ncbi:MAG: hypothetical protein NTV11_00470 [Rhodocyclales bacterium]|nr:hypothetical protein [Rhodocyclales bacterium]
MSSRRLRTADILVEGGSFQYYRLLPSDGLALAADWPAADLQAIGGILSAPGGVEQGNEADIDALGFALLAHGAKPLPDGVDWKSLADRLSLLYARQLKPDGSRALRMKAARANFFLRDLLDISADKDDTAFHERRFPDGFVWDWLPWNDGEIIADSRSENIHYRSSPERDWQSLSVGLPTQMDIVSAGSVAVTSCYSDGWYKWAPGDSAKLFPHHCPVVLAFDFQGDCFFLDRYGAVFCEGHRQPLVRLPVDTVWRARLVDGKVFVSDWSEPRRLTVLDTDGWQISVIDSGPVLLTNDLCKVGETYYVIDKMQGRVFSYDANFVPKGARMSFGKGAGCLYDPITLRFHQGNLCVLSWLTGALTEMSPF